MSEEDDTSVNRRSILKRAGAASVGLAGLSSVSAATDEQREKAMSTDRAQVLLDELGDPSVRRATRRQVDELDATSIVVHTEVGRLVYVETGSGQRGVQFHIEATEGRDVTEFDLPTRYDDIPAGGTGVLVVGEDERIEFVRSVSDAEERRLAAVTGVDPDESEMFYSSPIDGFEVHVVADDGTETASLDGAISREAYYVRTDSHERISRADVEAVPESDLVRAQGECETWAERCMQQIVVCTGCLGLCISVPFTNIPGVIVCITCVMGCHFTVPLACGKVVQNCG